MSFPKRSLGVLFLGVLFSAVIGCGGSSSDGGGDASAGEQLAKTNVCGSCHDSSKGTLAGGDMPASGSTSIFAPNLTPDTKTGLGSWTDAQITAAIKTGVDDEGAHLCSIMPQYPFTDQQLADLVAYLRSLPAVDNEVPEGKCDAQ